MALLSLLLLASANAGFYCLPKGWILSWQFEENHINFALQLDLITIQKYGWVGIGFKLANDPRPGMRGADLINIILGEMPEDCYGVYNDPPVNDKEILGGENFTEFGKASLRNTSLDEETYTFRWTRDIDTHDEFDLPLYEGTDVKILWACGQLFGGFQARHYPDDHAYVFAKFSNDFESECEEKAEPLVHN